LRDGMSVQDAFDHMQASYHSGLISDGIGVPFYL